MVQFFTSKRAWLVNSFDTLERALPNWPFSQQKIRFFLGYFVLILAGVMVNAALAYSALHQAPAHKGVANGKMPKAKYSKILARQVVQKFFGALTIPADYKVACGLTNFAGSCESDWKRFNVGLRSFTIKGVAVAAGAVEVGVSVDSTPGFVVLKWFKDKFLIDQLVTD